MGKIRGFRAIEEAEIGVLFDGWSEPDPRGAGNGDFEANMAIASDQPRGRMLTNLEAKSGVCPRVWLVLTGRDARPPSHPKIHEELRLMWRNESWEGTTFGTFVSQRGALCAGRRSQPINKDNQKQGI